MRCAVLWSAGTTQLCLPGNQLVACSRTHQEPTYLPHPGQVTVGDKAGNLYYGVLVGVQT